jgi:dipeptide/tripeptide permease
MTGKAERAEEEDILLPPDGGGEKRRPRRDFFGALFLLAISAAFIVQALRMPFKDPSWEWYTAPNIFPLGMAICLGASALFVAVRGFVRWRANSEAIGPMRFAKSAKAWGMGRFLAGVALIAFLIFLLGKIDFYLLAPGSIMVFGLVFRSDPLAKAFKSSLIAALFIVSFLFIISIVFP